MAEWTPRRRRRHYRKEEKEANVEKKHNLYLNEKGGTFGILNVNHAGQLSDRKSAHSNCQRNLIGFGNSWFFSEES